VLWAPVDQQLPAEPDGEAAVELDNQSENSTPTCTCIQQFTDTTESKKRLIRAVQIETS